MTGIPDFPDHLRPDEVLQIIDFMAGCDPIIVGGQSVNIWAEYYVVRDPSLETLGPFTSRDVDFFRNKQAARQLAASLESGTVLLPTPTDMGTPNAAVVLGELNGRRVVVDFMASVLGVEDESITDNFVAIEGRWNGATINLLVMHPLDCLRSRLANINTLRRFDEHSIRQAVLSLRVLEHYLGDVLAAGNFRSAQRILKDLQFVVRDQHLGRPSHRRFGAELDILDLIERFVSHPDLDQRWRELVLRRAIERLRSKAGEEDTHQDDPDVDPTSGAASARP